ncbi:DUF2141 domain-containing protein [Fulvivirga lutimaris]|uniref:DUF2141 domain-containing protein n=1 Tax=Fulvivirga lutimaris TaxID=1819566 RepID=UPI0012BC0799|nr:DUF2141 domain-containing protein [Fulvivirga lutimaris]MTI39866.1 DUF2141 domain-containing protein [Fulvivirga lutimaris]
MKFTLSVFLVFLLAMTSFKAADTSQLVVVIDDIRDAEGEIIFAVFNNEQDFLQKEYTSQKVKVGEDGKVVAIFNDLPKGNYSVSVIHDKNLNGKLDKNFIGIPTEGFGFSNNKMGRFGPPSFKDCEIELVQSKVEINIKLKHI